jgi:hypothetical protein
VKLLLARSANPVAVVCFVTLVVLEKLNVAGPKVFALLIPAGLLIALRGILMLAFRDEVLSRLIDIESRSAYARFFGVRKESAYGAVLAIIIGVGWCVIGVMVAVGAWGPANG